MLDGAQKQSTLKELRRHWKEAGRDKLLALFQQQFPNDQWQPTGEHKAQGCCCIHNDSSPSAWFDAETGVYHCSSCGAYYRDLTRLLMDASKKTEDYSTVYKRIIVVELGLKVPKAKEQELQEHSAQQKANSLFVGACVQALVDASQNPGDPSWERARPAISYLKSRNIDVMTAAEAGVGILPPFQYIYQHATKQQQSSLNKLREMYEKDGTLSTNSHAIGPYGGWLVVPHFLAPDTLGRVKLREPKSGGGTRWSGPGSEEGLFGLHCYNNLLGSQQKLDIAKTIYVMEGEFDMLSFRQQMSNSSVDTIVVSGSGAGVGGISDLTMFGFERVISVGDYDRGGRNFNKRIISQMSESPEASVYAFSYPEDFNEGDDPDEIIQRGDYTDLYNALHNDENWLEPYEWCSKEIDREISQTRAPDLSLKLRLVREYGDLLPELTARENFIDTISGKLNLNSSQLHRELASADTPTGFITAIKHSLLKVMQPLAYVSGSHSRVYVHHKIHDDIVEIDLENMRAAMVKLQTKFLDTDLFSYISHELGIPEFIKETDDGKRTRPRSDRSQRDDIEFYFKEALKSLVAEETQGSREYTIKRQGVHYVDNTMKNAEDVPEDAADECLLNLNGKKTFYANLDKKDNGTYVEKPQWKQLGMPLYGDILLDKDANSMWSMSTQDVEDLNEPISFSEAKENFEKMIELYKECFVFKHPDVDPKFLAASAMITPLLMAYDSFPQIGYTGVTTAGKSTCMKLFDSGKRCSLIECSRAFDDFTSAGLSQSSHGSSLSVVTDEFESPDDNPGGNKSRNVSNTLEMARNLAGGASIVRGSQHGESRETVIRFQLHASMIHVFNRPEDLNRWVFIELEPPKKGRNLNPAVLLRTLYSREEFEEMRRINTLYVLQNAGAFLNKRDEAYTELFEKGRVRREAARFVHAAIPVCSVLGHFGLDYMEYAKEHAGIYTKTLEMNVLSDGDKVFRAITQSPNVSLPQDDRRNRTINSILNDPDLAQKLSGSNCGVYYMPGKDYIVIDPYSVTVGLLAKHNLFRHITNSQTIYRRLLTHECVYKASVELDGEDGFDMLEHIAPYLGRRISPDELLLIYLDDIHGGPEPPDETHLNM